MGLVDVEESVAVVIACNVGWLAHFGTAASHDETVEIFDTVINSGSQQTADANAIATTEVATAASTAATADNSNEEYSGN